MKIEDIEVVIRANIKDIANKLTTLTSQTKTEVAKAVKPVQELESTYEELGSTASKNLEKIKAQLDITDREIELQRRKVKALQKQYDESANKKGLSIQLEKAKIQLDKMVERSIGLGDKFEQLKNQASSVKQEVKKIGDETKKVSSKSSTFLGKVVSRLKSLAILMLIRKMLSQIGEGFKQLAKENQSFNKAVSNMQGAFAQLRNSMASAFAPIITAIEPVITKLINLFAELFNKISMITGAIAGNGKTFTKATKVTTDYAKSLDNASSSAKRSLASFDELNVLSDNNSSSSGTSENQFAEENIDSGFSSQFDNLRASLETLAKAFEPIQKNIGEGLKWLYDNVLVPLSKWTIGNLLPSFINTLASALKVLNAVMEIAKPILKWLWESFLKPIAKFTGGILVAWLNAVGEQLSTLADWLNGDITFEEACEKWANSVKGFVENFKVYFKEFGDKMIEVFASIWVWLVNFLSEIFYNIGEAVVNLGVKIIYGFKNALDETKKYWLNVADWFNTYVIKPITKFFTQMWGGIKGTFGEAGVWFTEHFLNPIVNCFKALYNSCRTIISAVVNGLIGIFNKLIQGVNSAIDTINEIPGVKIARLKLMQQVEFPELANGGVIKQRTNVVVGEYPNASNNPEIVSPQDLMYETNLKANVPVINAVEEMTDRLTSALNDIGVYAEFDYSKLRVGLNKEAKRSGNKVYGGAY